MCASSASIVASRPVLDVVGVDPGLERLDEAVLAVEHLDEAVGDLAGGQLRPVAGVERIGHQNMPLLFLAVAGSGTSWITSQCSRM